MPELARIWVTLPLLALACGSNAPEVPRDLLGGESTCAAPDYPEAGLGKEPGDVVANLCFSGYRSPATVPPGAEHLETIAFSDYYDPAGSKGVGLLMVNTAAIWCSACTSEHRGLPARQEQLGGQGLVIFGTLFQDAQRNPASIEDLDRWVANFDVNFPMVTDPELLMGAYAQPDAAPLNMVIDPRTMRILAKYVGDQGAVMWPYIESELELRNSAR